MPYRLTARVSRHKLEEVVDALADIGVRDVSVSNAEGFYPGGPVKTYRGVAYPAPADAMLLEAIIPAGPAGMIAQLVAASVWAGAAGDGLVWLTPLDVAIHLATGTHVREVLESG